MLYEFVTHNLVQLSLLLHRKRGRVTSGVNGVIVRSLVVLVKESESWCARMAWNRKHTEKRNNVTRKIARQHAVVGLRSLNVPAVVVGEFNTDNEIVHSPITSIQINSSSPNQGLVKLNPAPLRGRSGRVGSPVQHRVTVE